MIYIYYDIDITGVIINSMRDLSKAKIYKIFNSVNDKLYIGSTTNELTKRLSKHKGENNNMLIVQAMRELGKEHFL